jgi:hypothetical protein
VVGYGHLALVVGYGHLADATGVSKMWGRHTGEWGCSGRVEEQILEAGLEVLQARICEMVGDVKKESVLRGGTAFFLPWQFVLVDEACFEKRGECLRWAATFS